MNFNLTSTELPDALADVEALAGYHFKNNDLLMEALTHPSFSAEAPKPTKHNQRLEFLGDAVLQIITSVFLYHHDTVAQEGMLTRMRSYLANEAATASYAVRLKLDRVLRLGHGDAENGARQRPSILGDLFEAFLGALYLDGGYDEAEKFCLKLFPPLNYVKDKLVVEENPKGALQELCQQHKMGTPSYKFLNQTGPKHAPIFEMAAFIAGKEIGRAKGTNQKNAERNAALQAWHNLQEQLKGKKMDAVSTSQIPILALDFDGVICDSAAETAISGWKAASKIWPDLFKKTMPGVRHIAAFRKVRPYLETGFDSILMTKMLQEKVPVEEFATHLNEHFERIKAEYHLNKADLIALFGATRDQWLEENAAEWLECHGFYEGTLEALNSALKRSARILILTTKQERFVSALLKNHGVDFPQENIYGLERKRKKEALLEELLTQNPPELHFVEDRLKTLLRVEAEPCLETVKLHYAPWGYGTPNDEIVAQDDPHIQVDSLKTFCQWLSHFSEN